MPYCLVPFSSLLPVLDLMVQEEEAVGEESSFLRGWMPLQNQRASLRHVWDSRLKTTSRIRADTQCIINVTTYESTPSVFVAAAAAAAAAFALLF